MTLSLHRLFRQTFLPSLHMLSRSVISDSLRSHDCSLPGALVTRILQARMLGCAANQAPPFMEFFRQEY